MNCKIQKPAKEGRGEGGGEGGGGGGMGGGGMGGGGMGGGRYVHNNNFTKFNSKNIEKCISTRF